MKRENNGGFSLVELMVAVAIMMVLGTIAVSNFLSTSQRTKRAELPTNLAAIRVAEQAYFHVFDTYTTVVDHPGVATLGPGRNQWTGPPDWVLLGWKPDGGVRGTYEIDAQTTTFTGIGLCDVDGEGGNAEYRADEVTKPRLMTPSYVY